MAHGIQTFDASGNVLVDYSTRLGRVLGILTGQEPTGSHVDSQMTEGTPWAFALPDYSSTSPVFPPFPSYDAGVFGFSGSTMTWSGLTPDAAHRIVYGVY